MPTINITDNPTIRKLIDRIESIPDSEDQSPSSEETLLIAQILIQKFILSHPHLNQTIQELIDDFHFS